MVVDVASFGVIDVDTHVVEPPDLWTARMPASVHDRVPHVRWDDQRGEEAWFVNDLRLVSVGEAAHAGWDEWAPDHPKTWQEVDPATYDPKLRAARMDEYGIRAQIPYPNVALIPFGDIIAEMEDPQLQLEVVRTYNDWLSEWASQVPGRIVPVATLPFWDVELTVAEIERTHEMGFKGINFSQNPAAFGLPDLTDRQWDPMWATAQERGMPVNFHIATGGGLDAVWGGNPQNGRRANYAAMPVSFFLANARTIAQLITGGICHRFPELNFVSVESGVGWIPFALEALDWQWKNNAVAMEHPEYDLLPSEYFQRQIYGCFWFEQESMRYAVEQLGPDNILYETDFPHPTSMSPGPGSTAIRPDQYITTTIIDQLGQDIARKILHDNADRIYHLDD